MDAVKVVVRYSDGKVIKGYTQDFFPNKDRFHLQPQQKSSGQDKPQGRKMEIIFKDGEKLVGSTLGYEPNRPGFFIHPADDKSNNIRVFVVQAFVDKVRNL
jgi:hypothetical protein